MENRDEHAWIWNLSISDELYQKYSIRPDVGLNCERAVQRSLRSRPLDGKLSTCNVAIATRPIMDFTASVFRSIC